MRKNKSEGVKDKTNESAKNKNIILKLLDIAKYDNI